MGSMKEIFNSLLLRELFKGMSVTGRYMFARKITVQYPDEKTPQSFRFRGLHALRRYPNGEEHVYDVVADPGETENLIATAPMEVLR